MKLEAMVAQSTFEDIANDLTGNELTGVSYTDNYNPAHKTLLITAEASPERIMEIAQRAGAGIAKFNSLQDWDRLVISGFSKAGKYFSPDRTGSICFWTKSPEEKF